MGAYRDENKNGTWYCKFSYVNWKGQKLSKKKRGFLTKKEALAWEKEFLNGQAGSVELTFREFFELYKMDKKRKLQFQIEHLSKEIWAIHSLLVKRTKCMS